MAKRAILDTNLWISFLISKNFSQLDIHLESGQITLVFSKELLVEFLAVVKRPKFVKYFSEENIASLMEAMNRFGEIVEVKSKLDLCRDEKDNFLINLAKDSKADYLVTGDKDLLILKELKPTRILSFSDFIADISE